METEEIKLSQITSNEDNPRLITDENFAKLVRSLLVFPRMLTLRPVVVDETLRVLGGNMRLKALQRLVNMSEGEMRKRISEDKRATAEMCNALVEYWTDWMKSQLVTVVKADDLTEAQKAEFIAKDNISYGAWDYEQLANHWDEQLLQSWGMPIWAEQPDEPTTTDNTTDRNTDDSSSVSKEQIPQSAAPEGRIEIHFARQHAMALGQLLGVGELDRVVYRFEDLPINKEGGEQ